MPAFGLGMTGLILTLGAAAHQAGAAPRRPDPVPRPAWASGLLAACQAPENAAALSDTRFRKQEDWVDDLFDERVSADHRQRWVALNRAHEYRQHHGLTGPTEEARYRESVGELSMSAVDGLRKSYAKKKAEQVRVAAARVVENDEGWLRVLKGPVGVLVFAAAASTGETLKFRLAPQYELESSTDLRKRTGRFQLLTPHLDSEFSFLDTAPTHVNGQALDLSSPSARDERMRLSLRRRMPFWSLSSGLSYGSTTTTLTASLSKPIFAGLSCVVDKSSPLDPARGTRESDQERLLLQYGVQF